MPKKKTKPNNTWRNRIVGYGDAPPEELVPHPLNWRSHPESQREAVNDSLDSVGWVQDIIVNKRSGFMLDGHLRVEEAMAAGEETVPIKYVDLAEAEEAQVLATLDPMAALAEADAPKLQALLTKFETERAGLLSLLEKTTDAAGLWNEEGQGEEGATGGAPPGADEEWVTFSFGMHTGRVSRALYEDFNNRVREAKAEEGGDPTLDGILRVWIFGKE